MASSEDSFRSGPYLTFRVGRQEFAIEAAAVKAVLPAHELIAFDAPYTDCLAGESRLRGCVFPVIDLRAKLQLRHGITGRTPCIVVVEHGGLVGFLADAVSEVVLARASDYRNGKIRIGRPRQIVPLDTLLVDEPVTP